jgi:hypothetical protein
VSEIKLDSEHLSIDTLKRAADKAGSDGWDTQAAQHLHAVIRAIEAQIQPEPPVTQARDEYAEQMNLELRRSIAARVLEAMDVDQYLIDAVRAATPPEAQIQPPVPAEPTEWGSLVRARVEYDVAPLLLTYVPNPYESNPDTAVGYPWYSEQDSWHRWADLSDVEVLRVGVGPSPEAVEAVPVEKVRQVLRSSPTGYLTDQELLTAYRDLRKRLAALLPEGAQ